VYRLLFSPEFGVQEAAIDGWSGAIHAPLEGTFSALQDDPLIGECSDPLGRRWSYTVSLFLDHLRVVLIYRIDSSIGLIGVLEIRVDD
jgi:hypothetical protein